MTEEKSVKLGEIDPRVWPGGCPRGCGLLKTSPCGPWTINRPGLPLTGFFEHFDTERLLLIGLTEHTYLSGLTLEKRRSILTSC